jgi:hypothetical protein
MSVSSESGEIDLDGTGCFIYTVLLLIAAWAFGYFLWAHIFIHDSCYEFVDGGPHGNAMFLGELGVVVGVAGVLTLFFKGTHIWVGRGCIGIGPILRYSARDRSFGSARRCVSADLWVHRCPQCHGVGEQQVSATALSSLDRDKRLSSHTTDARAQGTTLSPLGIPGWFSWACELR